MCQRRQQKHLRRQRQDNQLRRRTDTVHRETLQPFSEVVAFCAEDKMLVTEKRNRNRKRLRRNRRKICDKRLTAMRQQMPKQDHKSRIKPQREQRIRYSDQQESNHLARRQNPPKRGKRTMCSGIWRRLIVEKGDFVAGHTLHSSRNTRALRKA